MPSLIRMSLDWMARSLGCGAGSAGVTHGEGGGTTCDLGDEPGHDALHRHRAHVFTRAAAQARGAVLGPALPPQPHGPPLSHPGGPRAVRPLLASGVSLCTGS